jgi:hypothetical protein
MRFAQFLLLAVFTLLQGVAPLLHAHVTEGPHNGTGLHAPEIGPPVALAGEAAMASERQSPYVDVAEQWRRATHDLAPPRTAISLAIPRIERVSALIPRDAAVQRHSPSYARPPAQAPPGTRV